jgi:hypothetical protein
MKIKNALPKLVAIFLFIVGLASCEEDFEPLVSDIGVQNFDTDLYISDKLISYSKKLEPVQTNGLPSYQLGVYNDPVFGKSTVSLLSQVIMETPNPDFGDSTELMNVYLYIPFYASGVDTDGVIEYTLDSVYGDAPINISLFESNYFLRDFDPQTNFEEAQKYYSNEAYIFDDWLGAEISSIEDFMPSADEILVTEDDPATEENEEVKLPPGIRVELPLEFFNDKIINLEGEPELLNNNNFKEYFRGINFKVSSNNDEGNLFIFDIEKADITLNYSHVTTSGTGDDITYETEEDSFLLRLGGISINTFQNQLNPVIASALENPDMENGEESLYLRGGDGIITVIELFKDVDELKIVNGELVAGENGVPDELDEIRINNWLINEANLIFYVDQDKIEGGDAEPERLVIYNLNSSRLLPDFNFDISSSIDPINGKTEHLGRLDRGSDENGDFYKIRITNFLSDVIRKDTVNAALGLMVSQNVLVTNFLPLKDEQAPGIKKVPAASVVSPQGTIVFGNNTSNEEKRLKLQIYYTKPD